MARDVNGIEWASSQRNDRIDCSANETDMIKSAVQRVVWVINGLATDREGSECLGKDHTNHTIAHQGRILGVLWLESEGAEEDLVLCWHL